MALYNMHDTVMFTKVTSFGPCFGPSPDLYTRNHGKKTAQIMYNLGERNLSFTLVRKVRKNACD